MILYYTGTSLKISEFIFWFATRQSSIFLKNLRSLQMQDVREMVIAQQQTTHLVMTRKKKAKTTLSHYQPCQVKPSILINFPAVFLQAH